jgi:hypothetical protein
MTLDFRVAAYWGDRCFDLAHSIQHFSYGFFKNWFYAFSIDWHIHYPPINKIAFWRLCCIQVEMGRKKKRLLPADGRWWSPLAFRHIFYHAPLLFTWSCVCVCARARLEENDLFLFFNSCHSCSALSAFNDLLCLVPYVWPGGFSCLCIFPLLFFFLNRTNKNFFFWFFVYTYYVLNYLSLIRRFNELMFVCVKSLHRINSFYTIWIDYLFIWYLLAVVVCAIITSSRATINISRSASFLHQFFFLSSPPPPTAECDDWSLVCPDPVRLASDDTFDPKGYFWALWISLRLLDREKKKMCIP